MASSSKGSKLLPIAVLLIITGLLAGGYYFTQVGISDGKGGRQVLDFKTGRLKTVTIDADLASDTLNTIAIDSADIKDKFKGIEEANFEQQKQMRDMAEVLRQLNQTNRALKSQLEQQNRKMASVEDAVSSSPTLDADSIKESILSVLQKNLPELMPQTEGATKPSSDEYSITDKEVKPIKETRTRLRSYGLPIDAKGQISPAYLKSLDNAHDDSDLSVDTNNQSLIKQNSPTVDPRFTIPADAALFDSVTITALVGRIPRDGDVNDPSPFKVAIGRDNLAANGFSLPGIDGMIMSGIVYGDAVRKCVRTKITRATYIFEDGRILTLPKKRKGKVIGYLADPQGDIRLLVSDCTIGYNFSVSCNTRLKSRRKIQAHSIYVSAKIHFDTFYSKQDIAVGIFLVRNNHFLTSQMFFDYRVASLSSTHSKTRHSDVI